MRRESIWVAALATIALACPAWAEEKFSEEELALDKIPSAVKATLDKQGGKIAECDRKTKGEKTWYEADVIKDGKKFEVRVQPDGTLISSIDTGEGAEEAGEGKEGGGEQVTGDAKERAQARQALIMANVSMVKALETALKLGKGAKPFKADLEIEEGKAIYDIELLDGEKGPELEIDAVTGEMTKFETVEEQEKEDAKEAGEGKENNKEEQEENKEKAEAAKALPHVKLTLADAVKIAIKETKGAKPYSAVLEVEGGKAQFAIDLISGDRGIEVDVDPASGTVTNVETVVDSKKGEAGAFREKFNVDKANLSSTGKAPYFILIPGHRTIHEHGNEKLTISILDETKMIDGVETRVLEEREEKNGHLVEISRNYFAMDKKTGDVYYFGEDTDEYRDGKVSSHEGGWLSGEKGATFGLMIAGKPKVGDKYYQEHAPRVAMDRVEVLAVDEELKMPAGTFKCVHLKETTPLESDVSHKWYAPGIGMVKDDSLTLVKVEKP